MRISIAHVDESGHVTLTETEVAQGATAADVLARRGIDAGAGIALFGERITPETELHEGDRLGFLDVAAPLTIDPMEARRLRAQKKAALRDVSRGRHGGRHRLAVSDV